MRKTWDRPKIGPRGLLSLVFQVPSEVMVSYKEEFVIFYTKAPVVFNKEELVVVNKEK